MAGTPCGACGATLAAGWHLCHNDTLQLEYQLQRVFDVYGTIQATLERRDVGAESMGSSSGHASSVEPCNIDVLDYALTLEAILTGWAAQIPAMRPARRDPHIIAGWMLQPTTMNLIRRQEWAANLTEELADALHPLSRAADRTAPKSFAGMCPAPATHDDSQECNTAVYVRPGHPYAQCQRCTAVWDVTEWRARALEAAGHHTGTPAEVSRMLSNPATGDHLPAATIRSWIRRGKLAHLGHNQNGKPVYQVRKVRALWVRGMVNTYTRNLTTRDKTPCAA